MTLLSSHNFSFSNPAPLCGKNLDLMGAAVRLFCSKGFEHYLDGFLQVLWGKHFKGENAVEKAST